MLLGQNPLEVAVTQMYECLGEVPRFVHRFEMAGSNLGEPILVAVVPK